MKEQDLKLIRTFVLALLTILGAITGEAQAGREGGNGGSRHQPQPTDSNQMLLHFYQSSSSAGPRYDVWSDCNISETNVTFVAGAPGVIPAPTVRNITWTTAVPDASAILDLLDQARSGEVKGYHSPRGGSYSSYLGFIQNEGISLDPVDQYGGNRSIEAAVLVAFIDVNCRQ